MVDYQLSFVRVNDNVGRMEYRSFSDDAAAMKYARELLGDFNKVTVLEGLRIVGVILDAQHRLRANS